MSAALPNDQELQATSAILRALAAYGMTVDMAERAAEAAKQIDLRIDSAYIKALNFLDKFPGNHDPFAPQLLRIQVAYRAYVWATYALSLAIATYGEDFDNKVIKLCADTSLTVEQRRDKIGQFIKSADGIHTLSRRIMTNLDDLKSDMTNFVAAFNAWKNRIIEGLHDIINIVSQELEDMERDLGRIRTVAGLAMGHPVSAGSNVEMAGASTRTESPKDYVDDAITAIDALGKLWQAMTNDSLAIELWLKDGAIDADMPEYMKISLDSAASAYANMAVPLKKYAQILTEKDIPKP